MEIRTWSSLHKSRRQKHPVNDVCLQHGKSKFKVVKLFLLPGLVPCGTARAFVWSAHRWLVDVWVSLRLIPLRHVTHIKCNLSMRCWLASCMRKQDGQILSVFFRSLCRLPFLSASRCGAWSVWQIRNRASNHDEIVQNTVNYCDTVIIQWRLCSPSVHHGFLPA